MKGKNIDRDITEHKGKIKNSSMHFVEYKSDTDKRKIVSQNKCVFEVHPGLKGQVKTLGCYKSAKSANAMAKKKALQMLGK